MPKRTHFVCLDGATAPVQSSDRHLSLSSKHNAHFNKLHAIALSVYLSFTAIIWFRARVPDSEWHPWRKHLIFVDCTVTDDTGEASINPDPVCATHTIISACRLKCINKRSTFSRRILLCRVSVLWPCDATDSCVFLGVSKPVASENRPQKHIYIIFSKPTTKTLLLSMDFQTPNAIVWV